jgi:hypothetical protein
MSDEVNIDLTNYKDKIGSRVLPGRYLVMVEDAETDTAKSGNTMINLWFRIQGGEFDGSTIVDRLVLTDKSMFRVVGFMQGIGLPTPKKRLRLNVRQFVGKTLEIDVEDGDPYNGRVKSEVRGYNRVAGSAAAAAEAVDLEDMPPARSTTEVLDSIDTEDGSVAEVDLDAVDLG